MYFSKNSKYVFNKASWMSPSSYILRCLKSPQKNFGIKIPQEDPTKPPLRVNIPKDSDICEPDFSKHLLDSSNSKKCLSAPRSKSVASRTNFPVNLPMKSESATHISGLSGSAFVSDEHLKKPQTQIPDGVPYYINSEYSKHDNQILDSIFSDSGKDNKFNCEIENSFTPNKINEDLTNSYLSAEPNPNEKTEIKAEENLPDEDESKKKTLYIVIDIPEKAEEKKTQSSNTEAETEKSKNLSLEEYGQDSVFSEMKNCTKVPKTKADQLFSSMPPDLSNSRSKSLPRFEGTTTPEPLLSKSRSKMGFEVHEIDDAPAYIFHLRFKKNFWNKINAVEQVPEKEVTTRSSMVRYEENNEQDPKVLIDKSFKSPIKEGPSIFESMLLADKQKPISNNEDTTVPTKNYFTIINDQINKANALEKKSNKKKIKDNPSSSDSVSEFKNQDSQEGDGQILPNPSVLTDKIENPYSSINKSKKRKNEVVDTSINQNILEPESQTDFSQVENQSFPNINQTNTETEKSGIVENQTVEADIKESNQGQTFQEGESQTVSNFGTSEEVEVLQPTILDNRNNKTIKETNQSQYPLESELQIEGFHEGESQPTHNLVETIKEKENEDILKQFPLPENMPGRQNEVSQEVEGQTTQTLVEQTNKEKESEDLLSYYPTPENTPPYMGDIYHEGESQPTQNLIESTKEKENDDILKQYPTPTNIPTYQTEITQEADSHPGQNIMETVTEKEKDDFYKTNTTGESIPSHTSEFPQDLEGQQTNTNLIETIHEKESEEVHKVHPTTENVTKTPEKYLKLDNKQPDPSTKGEPRFIEDVFDSSFEKQDQKPPPQQPPSNAELLQPDDSQYAQYPYVPIREKGQYQEIPVELPEKKQEGKAKKPNKTNKNTSKDRKPKKPSKPVHKERFPSGSKVPQHKFSSEEGYEPDITEFKPASNVVNISCDKAVYNNKYCAAFPPTLNEAMRYRGKCLGFKRDSLLSHKWSSTYDFSSKEFEMNPKCLSANSEPTEFLKKTVFFPNQDKKQLHSDMLLNYKKDGILNVVKAKTEENLPKMGDNMVNITNQNLTEDKGQASVDTLRMMQKVKEIVDFDLKNAIKIFQGRDQNPETEVSSVVTTNGDSWNVNSEELKKCIEAQQNQETKEMPSEEDESSSDKKNLIKTHEHQVPKYLPSKKEKKSNIKVENTDFNSVVNFNFDKNEFMVNNEELQKAVQYQAEEILKNNKTQFVAQNNNDNDDSSFDLEKNTQIFVKCERKEGDSILVFDEESQTWKVDFSILEKRKQLQEEEELTKKSELILETIEKLEKGEIAPKTEPTEKKFFDYDKREWKVYPADKNTMKEKSKKAKTPFKESDAEEIRKKNSDMYEDLFAANKKDTEMNQNRKDAPGISDSKKEGKFDASSGNKKEAESGSSTKGTGKTQEPGTPKSSKIEPPNKKTDVSKSEIKEDDNFWESFLKMEILPRRVPQPTTKPADPAPAQKSPEEPEKQKKIEEPRFRIHIPFIGDKKNDSLKKKGPSKTENKTEFPSKNSGSSQVEKTKDPPVKAPQSGPVVYKDDRGSKPPPTIGEANSKDPKNLSNVKTNVDVTDPSPPTEKKVSDSTNAKPLPQEAPANKSTEDHFASESIVEITKTSKEKDAKTNNVENVKLNIASEKPIPSKVTEINLKKKGEEATAGVKKQTSSDSSKSTEKKENILENRKFYKNFEKYKTPYGDPEYEEKSVKINLDIESNPNLKKLDNWNKTLVLHDIAKPPENIESWLKDETDKMATLLLKVLQEAAAGKPKKKSTKSKSCEKLPNKANPYENIRKKQESNPENFLLKVRSVNFLPNAKKGKGSEDGKSKQKSDFNINDIPVQTGKSSKSSNVVDAGKLSSKNFSAPSIIKLSHIQSVSNEIKYKDSDLTFNPIRSVMPREFWSSPSFLEDPAEEIPGPEILKKISNAWKVFPVLSCQLTIFTLFKMFQSARRSVLNKVFNRYGPIVNIQGVLSGNVILLYKPEHVKEVFEQDVTVPVRSIFDSLEQCRREVEDRLQMTGVPMDWNNPEWRELRKVLNDPLLKGCEKFFSTIEAAGESLVHNIRRNKIEYNQDPYDFMDEIKKWSSEGLCNVLFQKSYKFLESNRNSNVNWILEPEKLYSCIEETTEYLSKCEKGFQTWRLIGTPSSIGLLESYRNLSNMLHKQLYQAEINLKNKNDLLKEGISLKSLDMTFVESMVLNDGMSVDEITCNLIDILVMGINSTSSAMGFLLYDLAQNEKARNKLFNEVKLALPKKSSRLDYHKLHSLKYLQACVKESLRMHLPLPVFYRVLQRNILLSSYIVPRGTYVVMDSKMCSMKEQIFDEPEKYFPERWLTEDQYVQNNHPFTAIPFCHGPRSELARRVVELHLWSCTAKVIRNFQIEYQYGEIGENENLITFPNKPLKLNFIEREE